MGTTRGYCALFSTNPGSSTSTKQQLYGHLLPISQTIQVKRTRYTGYNWESKNKLINDDNQWTPTRGHTSTDRPAKKLQLCANTESHHTNQV